jgi:hypothetical protein
LNEIAEIQILKGEQNEKLEKKLDKYQKILVSDTLELQNKIEHYLLKVEGF